MRLGDTRAYGFMSGRTKVGGGVTRLKKISPRITPGTSISPPLRSGYSISAQAGRAATLRLSGLRRPGRRGLRSRGAPDGINHAMNPTLRNANRNSGQRAMGRRLSGEAQSRGTRHTRAALRDVPLVRCVGTHVTSACTWDWDHSTMQSMLGHGEVMEAGVHNQYDMATKHVSSRSAEVSVARTD